MRLGFAVAIHVDPDILLVDEVLAVGDEGFTHKCLDKFAEFRRLGKTILLVTHSLSLVERFCDEALWLDGGRARAHGDPRRVVDAYLAAVEKSEEPRSRRRPQRLWQRRSAASPGRARPAQAAPHGRADRHVPGPRGPLGIARSRDHRRHAPRRPAAPSFVFHSGDADGRAAAACGPRAGRRLRLRRQPVQRRRRLLLRHEHLHRGNGPAAARGRASRSPSRWTASTWSRAPTSSTSPSTRATAIPTTTTGCCIPSASSRAPDVGIYRPRHHWSFDGAVSFGRRHGHDSGRTFLPALLLKTAMPRRLHIPAETPAEAAQTVVDLVSRRLPSASASAPARSRCSPPMHRGEAGVGALNALLQERLNPARPGLPELRGAGRTYRPGDRARKPQQRLRPQGLQRRPGHRPRRGRRGGRVCASPWTTGGRSATPAPTSTPSPTPIRDKCSQRDKGRSSRRW